MASQGTAEGQQRDSQQFVLFLNAGSWCWMQVMTEGAWGQERQLVVGLELISVLRLMPACLPAQYVRTRQAGIGSAVTRRIPKGRKH